MAGSTIQSWRGAVGVVLMLVALVALVAQRTSPGDHNAGLDASRLAAHRSRLRRAALPDAVRRSSGADMALRRDSRGNNPGKVGKGKVPNVQPKGKTPKAPPDSGVGLLFDPQGGSGAGAPVEKGGKGGKGKGPKAPKPLRPQGSTTDAPTSGTSPGKLGKGKGKGPNVPSKGKTPKAPDAGAGAGAEPGTTTAVGAVSAKGPKSGKVAKMSNATAKGAKSPKGPGEGAKLGGNMTTGPKASRGKGAKMGSATAKGPKGGMDATTSNAKVGKAPKKKEVRNVTTMEVSLPMPPGDCERQTVDEVKDNIGVVANATGQAALLDLAASEGKCTAAASASSRVRRATKDNFAVSLAFKDTVTPAQSASAVEAASAVIAAGNFSVSLGVGGAAKTVIVPKEANVVQGIRAAFIVAEAGGSGPQDPGKAEGSGAAATGGVTALLVGAFIVTGLV